MAERSEPWGARLCREIGIDPAKICRLSIELTPIDIVTVTVTGFVDKVNLEEMANTLVEHLRQVTLQQSDQVLGIKIVRKEDLEREERSKEFDRKQWDQHNELVAKISKLEWQVAKLSGHPLPWPEPSDSDSFADNEHND